MYNTNHVITVSKYYSCYTSTVMAPMKKIQDQKENFRKVTNPQHPPHSVCYRTLSLPEVNKFIQSESNHKLDLQSIWAIIPLSSKPVGYGGKIHEPFSSQSLMVMEKRNRRGKVDSPLVLHRREFPNPSDAP